ncbi:MAG: hypothetical protein J6W69_01080, partial [Bacteroidales bacterium]|nr:hypothetical protein [Bacteroidales bacterium]
MFIALIGLIAIQFSYLDEILASRKDQFNHAVNRALIAVSRQLERQETRAYIDENFDEDQRDALEQMFHDDDEPGLPPPHRTTQLSYQHSKVTLKNPDGSVQTFEFNGIDSITQFHLRPRGGNNIQSRQKTRQEMLLRQYLHQKDVFDDVIFRIMMKNNDRPILERVDIEQLRELITKNLQRDGYDLPFEFCLVDKDGRMAYQSPGYKADVAEREGSFMQILFEGHGPDV